MFLAAVLAAGVVALACVPFLLGDYGLSLAINIVSYTVLATAWSLFSGPTRYVSLATVAFFGIGAYTTAVFAETLPWPAVLAIAAGLSVVVAGIVGLSTLRLSGVYFVIFSFGLAELVRQLVTWYEVNKTRTLGRYVFTDITSAQIYWQLLVLAVLVFAAGFLIGRSRLGLALRAIGDDETVARHSGIDTTRAKVALFVLSTVFMTLDRRDHGAALDLHRSRHCLQSGDLLHRPDHGAAGRRAPALRAGAGRGAAGLLFEYLLARFPNHFSIMVGPGLHPDRLRDPARHCRPGRAERCGGRHERAARGRGPDAALRRPGRRRFARLLRGAGRDRGPARAPTARARRRCSICCRARSRPDAGRIALTRPARSPARPAHRIARLGIARTFQLVRPLASLTCRDNVLTGLAFGRRRAWGAVARADADALLDRVGLGRARDTLPGELTYIDQKRLELARALALQPDLLLLDEWLAGLNPTELEEGIALVQSLRGQGITILLVEHVMDAIRSLCDRCVVMNAGRLIATGLPSEVLADPEVIRAYLGDDGDA